MNTPEIATGKPTANPPKITVLDIRPSAHPTQNPNTSDSSSPTPSSNNRTHKSPLSFFLRFLLNKSPLSCINENITFIHIALFCCEVLAKALLYIVIVPCYILYAAAAWLFCGKDVTEDDCRAHPSSQCIWDPDFYGTAMEYGRAAKKLAKFFRIVWIRAVIFTSIWLVLNLTIPQLKRKFLLGCKLWKWSLLLALIPCGYALITWVTRLLLGFVCCVGPLKSSKSGCYYAHGLRKSVNLSILSWCVLVVWVFYFKTTRGLKKKPDEVDVLDILTWSFTTLAIVALLWVVKNALLLMWEADVVYGRFRDRIISAGFQLYFLGHICHWEMRHLEIFKPTVSGASNGKKVHHQDSADDDDHQHLMATSSSYVNLQGAEGAIGDTKGTGKTNEETEEMKRKAKENVLIERVKLYEGKTTYDIKKMTKYLMGLSMKSSREDDGTSYVLSNCKLITPSNAKVDITTKDLEEILKEGDLQLLFQDLRREHQLKDSEKKISYEKFEKSMERGHKTCVALGHTLSDAKAAVKVLNKTITGALITVAIIAWLRVTDIATDKILVLVASPFLAATFVFGDTCKKAFEGLIFSFASHPFTVGDQCIIDGVELEVKRMGIMTTKFIVIGTKQEALYPNSDLATKCIVNLKGEPNPNDRVELKLDISCTSEMVEFQDKITTFFEDDKGERFEGVPTITIEEIGSYIKMAIQYRHVLSIHEVTHSQCYEKKRKQKSELLLKIAAYINETGIKVAECI